MERNSSAWRKEIINDYKRRKPQRGAFAVRCSATGAVWVGTTLTLDTVQNRIWFGLRVGKYPDQALQAEWNAHGEGAFGYEILETLDEDANPLAIKDLLKAQRIEWTGRLAARPLL